jgi:opacity protein-like surface antigen
MKKTAAAFVFLLGAAAASWAVYPFPDIFKKFQVSVFGGFGLAKIRGTTTYGDIWSHQWLTRVEERTSIEVASRGKALALGAAFAYYFSSNIGVEASIGTYNPNLTTTSDFGFDWTWAPAIGGGNFSKSSAWEGTGKVRSIPLSLNFVGKFRWSNFEIFFSGGPTLFFNKLTAGTTFGYGITKTETTDGPNPTTTQYIDALGVGLEIRGKTWKAFGGNAGAGVVYLLTDGLGLSLEGRYFLCPEKMLDWDFVLGKYDGLFYSQTYPILKNISFTEDDAKFIRQGAKLTSLLVSPSCFQVLLGVKIFWGE